MIESKKFKSTIPQSEMPGYAGLTEAINTVDSYQLRHYEN